MLPVTGYIAPRLSALLILARNAIWALLGKQVPLEEGTLLGNLTDVYTARLDEQAAAQQAVYDAFDERNATGAYLDNLCALTGVYRLVAAKSVTTLTLGTAGGAPVVVPLGSSVADAAGQEWLSVAAATIPGGGTIGVEFSPPLTGPITAPAGALDAGHPGDTATIKTPITGWDTVVHAADAVPGRDRETHEELRLRRRESLQISGTPSTSALQAAIRKIAGVSQCKVVDNKTDGLLSVGSGVFIPAHTMLVVVYPDPAASATIKEAIANTIWKGAAGIASVVYSAVLPVFYTGTVIDAEGVSQTVKYSVATSLVMTCSVHIVEVDPLAPADDADVKSAILGSFGNFDDGTTSVLPMGENPRSLPVYNALNDIPEIGDVLSLAFVGAPGTFQVGTLIAANITVTH
jgi:hypothetical protein